MISATIGFAASEAASHLQFAILSFRIDWKFIDMPTQIITEEEGVVNVILGFAIATGLTIMREGSGVDEMEVDAVEITE